MAENKERLAKVEDTEAKLAEIVIMRGQEIDRLREKLYDEITHNAIESLPPAPGDGGNTSCLTMR